MTWADLVLSMVHTQAPSIPWEFACTVLSDKVPEEQLIRDGTIYNPEHAQQTVDLVINAWLLDTTPKYKVITNSCVEQANYCSSGVIHSAYSSGCVKIGP